MIKKRQKASPCGCFIVSAPDLRGAWQCNTRINKKLWINNDFSNLTRSQISINRFCLSRFKHITASCKQLQSSSGTAITQWLPPSRDNARENEGAITLLDALQVSLRWLCVQSPRRICVLRRRCRSQNTFSYAISVTGLSKLKILDTSKLPSSSIIEGSHFT